MAKWTFTEAAAKRIWKQFAERRQEKEYGPILNDLDASIKEEGFRSYDARERMIQWLGDNHPQFVTSIACDLSGELNALRKQRETLRNAFQLLTDCGGSGEQA